MQCISLGYWLPDAGVTFISHVLHNSQRLAQCNGSVPSNRAPSLFFDDYLSGDDGMSYANLDWNITRTVTLRPDTVTLYTSLFTQSATAPSATGGNDVLYGGAGSDFSSRPFTANERRMAA